MIFGYVRVSTVDQNLDRQIEGIGVVDRLFQDKCSGGTTNRPELQKLKMIARAGDEIVVYSIDRLARNLQDLLRAIDELNNAGVSIKFIKEGLTFSINETDNISKLQLCLMGAFAEFERSIIRERQAEGIALAKKRGVYISKPKLSDEMLKAVEHLKNEGVGVSKIAKKFSVSRQTIYTALKPK
jgi:DNA invertase Pin-like site-specific DNA recombinase